MKNQFRSVLFLVLALLLALTGCNLPTASPTPDFSAVIATQAAATLVAGQTQAASQPLTTATDAAPATATNLPVPTATNVPPPQVTRCNWASFITDVTIPDGTLVSPGAEFVKTWRLRNIGTCTWGSGYEFVFVDGNGLGANASVPLGATVAPGQTADVSITFKAPTAANTYRGNWKLRSADGIVFGIGGDASLPFWVDVKVREANKNFLYDFAINVCQAEWRSAADNSLPCPGDQKSKEGFVILLDDVRLENRLENEPTLWVHPDQALNSWITGTYPAIDIKTGDRFRAWVGCLDGYKNCDLRFKLEYSADGGPLTLLAEWNETFDGTVTDINLDLSALDGKSVKFTLSTIITGGQPPDGQGFWFVPRLIRP